VSYVDSLIFRESHTQRQKQRHTETETEMSELDPYVNPLIFCSPSVEGLGFRLSLWGFGWRGARERENGES